MKNKNLFLQLTTIVCLLFTACEKAEINMDNTYRMDLDKHIEKFELGMEYEEIQNVLGETDNIFFGTGGMGRATYGDTLQFGLDTQVWSKPAYVTAISVSGNYSGQSKQQIALGLSQSQVQERLGIPDNTLDNYHTAYPEVDFYLRSNHSLKMHYQSDTLRRITMIPEK